jgi:predicted secreted protein
MAIASGRKGQIKVSLPTALDADDASNTAGGGSAVIGNVRSWSLDTSSTSLDVTTMDVNGGFYRDFVPSFRTWSGSVDFLYDVTDTVGGDPDSLLRAGQMVYIWIYPESDAGSTATAFGGHALVTSLGRKASYDGLVECTLAFQGKGSLTQDDTF